MNRFAILAAVSAILLTGTGCGRRSASEKIEEKPSVAVSFPQQASLLREIAGDDFEVVTLLPPGTDPESYEPSMSTMKALTRSHLYFTMGSPGFEQSVLRGIEANFPDTRIVDSSEGIERLGHDHSHGHHHSHRHDEAENCPSADPHILTSVANARKMAQTMTQGLIREYPARKEIYSARLARFDSTLACADDSLRSIFSHGAAPFIVLHPSLSYFSRDYGLKQIAMEQEGKEPSPKQYSEILGHISGSRPAAIISERQHSSRRLEDMGETMGIPVIEVDLNSEGWLDELFRIARAISIQNREDKDKK